MRFLSTLGRLPNTWISLCVITLAGTAEGFGLALFVPLLDLMMKGSLSETVWPFTLIISSFETLRIPVSFPFILTAIVTLILSSLGLSFTQRYLALQAKYKIVLQLRETLASNLFHASWNYSMKQPHGEIINNFTTESSRAGNALLFELLAVATALQIAIFLIISSFISLPLTLIILAFGGAVVLILRPLHRRARMFGEATKEANRELSFHSLEFLRSLKLIKVTASEKAVLARLGYYIERAISAPLNADLNGLYIYFTAQGIPVILLAIVIVIAHGLLAFSPSSILVFLLILARIAPRLAQFQQQYQSYAITSPALRVVDEMIHVSGETKDRLNRGGTSFKRLTNGIVFKNVSYRYAEDETPVLTNVNLIINYGQTVAIVGSSGAGKSTLIDLMTGLREPSSGRILVDGMDISNLDIQSWRQKIGYVGQDVTIFNDTIRNNLLFSHPNIDDALFKRALRTAHLGPFIDELPLGLNTVLEESGVRLSGGQKQRIALARALIHKPELLLLDEATSALDNESERLVQETIENVEQPLTIVQVAHRLSTVRRADVIYVMEKGKIVETGTYDQLVANGGKFTELHRAQTA